MKHPPSDPTAREEPTCPWYVAPLLVYAAAGLTVSLIAHVGAYAGYRFGGMALFVGLHVGIFPLWPAVLFVARRLNGRSTQTRQTRDELLVHSPRWLRILTATFFLYAFVNFAGFFVSVFAHPDPDHAQHKKTAAVGPPPVVWRGFSGHWMAFYSAGLTVLTAAHLYGVPRRGQRLTPCRHHAPIDATDCPVCGTALVPPQSDHARPTGWRRFFNPSN